MQKAEVLKNKTEHNFHIFIFISQSTFSFICHAQNNSFKKQTRHQKVVTTLIKSPKKIKSISKSTGGNF